MKKRILFLAFAVFAMSATVLVSCNKDSISAVDQSLEARLSKDARFENTIVAATDLGLSLNIEALNQEANIQALKMIALRIENKTATPADYEQVKAITGLPYEAFIAKLKTFGESLYELNKAYPELADMKQEDLSSTFGKAIKANPEINNLVVNPVLVGETLRVGACPLQDICKLAVALVKIFAGDTICAAIGVATIPIIGGLICQLILTLGVAILNGICGVLPC